MAHGLTMSACNESHVTRKDSARPRNSVTAACSSAFSADWRPTALHMRRRQHTATGHRNMSSLVDEHAGEDDAMEPTSAWGPDVCVCMRFHHTALVVVQEVPSHRAQRDEDGMRRGMQWMMSQGSGAVRRRKATACRGRDKSGTTTSAGLPHEVGREPGTGDCSPLHGRELLDDHCQLQYGILQKTAMGRQPRVDSHG